MSRIKVLIVDDSAAARQALSVLLASDPGIQVLPPAQDAFDAAAKMRDGLPDVMLLDLELPRMNGLAFLRKIMAQHPLPVIVCSSHSEKGSSAALKAMEIGAAGVIGKPRLGTPREREEAQVVLSDAVRGAVQMGRTRHGGAGPAAPRAATGNAPLTAAAMGATAARRPAAAPMSPGPKLTADAVLPPPRKGAIAPANMSPLVAIGASTGGTEALTSILPKLQPTCQPIVIVLHMPEKFTGAFAQRLDSLSQIEVREAVNGDRPEPGLALLAPGSHHMVVNRAGTGYRVTIVDGPQVSRHRPSVDVLFRSTAIAAGHAAFGILLTGMGDDGARGLVEMRDCGAETLVQDEASSIVWGMPGEAFRMGAASRQVSLDRMPAEIHRFCAQVGV